MSEYHKMNRVLKKSALFLVFVGAATPALELRISLKTADEIETCKHIDSDDVSNTKKPEKHIYTGEKDVIRNETDEAVEKEAEQDKDIHKSDPKNRMREKTDKNTIEEQDADLSLTEKSGNPLDEKWDVVVDMWQVRMNEDIFITQPNFTLQNVIGRLSEVAFVEIERSGSNDRSLDMTWSNVESRDVEWAEFEPVVTKRLSMRPSEIDSRGGDTSTKQLKFSMDYVNAETDFDEDESRDGFLLKELQWWIDLEGGSRIIQVYLDKTTSPDVLTKLGIETGEDIFNMPIMTWTRGSLYMCGTRFSKCGRCLELIALVLFCIFLVVVCISCINCSLHLPVHDLDDRPAHGHEHEVEDNDRGQHCSAIECARCGVCIGWIIGAFASLFCWSRMCEFHGNTSWVYRSQKTFCSCERHEGKWSQRWKPCRCCRVCERVRCADVLKIIAPALSLIQPCMMLMLVVCMSTRDSLEHIQDAKQNPLECLHFLPKNIRMLYGDF